MPVRHPEWALLTEQELGADSPSRRDRISAAEERTKRLGLGLIITSIASMLDLPHQPTMTAAVLAQTFYARRSFAEYLEVETLPMTRAARETFGGICGRPQWVASTCLYLASKLEEVPRRISDIVNVMHQLQYPRALPAQPVPEILAHVAAAHVPPRPPPAAGEPAATAAPPPVVVGEPYYRAKEKVIALEHTVLRTLDFQVGVTHPHKYLLNYCQGLGLGQHFVQFAYGLLNDMVLHTTLRLQYSPATLAAGALNLAALLLERAPQLPHEWWRYFDMDMPALEAIGHDALNMYLHKQQLSAAPSSWP